MSSRTIGQPKLPGALAPFAGFASPTSNTTYTPNQFFDVCLPHRSRGCLRLVAYLVRKTLGWCDENGNPQQERHSITYSEIETKVGISRDMIRSAIHEAIDCHFIRCVDQPHRKRSGFAHQTGTYTLNWDEGGEYIKDPERFRGFFAGEGNRTYIPNAFFDRVIPTETLAVIKVVGSVIRFSIGFQTKWGHRRTNIDLSYQRIQNYSRLADRKTLAAAIQHALANNYLQRVEDGYFDPDGGRRSKAAVYALKWLNSATDVMIGQKTPPLKAERENRSENPTDIGQKTPPANRSENPTDIEIKQSNNTQKQKHPQPGHRTNAHVAVALERLIQEGFDRKAAQALALGHRLRVIEQQIEWIDQRRIQRNRLGMLRRAIEEDWAPPSLGKSSRRLDGPTLERSGSGADFAAAVEQTRRRLLTEASSTPS